MPILCESSVILASIDLSQYAGVRNRRHMTTIASQTLHCNLRTNKVRRTDISQSLHSPYELLLAVQVFSQSSIFNNILKVGDFCLMTWFNCNGCTSRIKRTCTYYKCDNKVSTPKCTKYTKEVNKKKSGYIAHIERSYKELQPYVAISLQCPAIVMICCLSVERRKCIVTEDIEETPSNFIIKLGRPRAEAEALGYILVKVAWSF